MKYPSGRRELRLALQGLGANCRGNDDLSKTLPHFALDLCIKLYQASV